jgi:hypothetical protein
MLGLTATAHNVSICISFVMYSVFLIPVRYVFFHFPMFCHFIFTSQKYCYFYYFSIELTFTSLCRNTPRLPDCILTFSPYSPFPMSSGRTSRWIIHSSSTFNTFYFHRNSSYDSILNFPNCPTDPITTVVNTGSQQGHEETPSGAD